MRALEVAVVGHVEWVHFVRAQRLPKPGEILRAQASWSSPAGGGAMAALEMARQGAAVRFFTACGDDDVGRRALAELRARRLAVEAAIRHTAHPQVFTYLTDDRERTITLLAPPLAPSGADSLDWPALRRCAGAYFCKGDVAALRHARAARVLVATARALPALAGAGVPVDVLVGSAHDPDERYAPGDLDPEPGAVVTTAGAAGGSYTCRDGRRGTYAPAPPPAELCDAYGAGDGFAGALTVALARGLGFEESLAIAAQAGAAALGRAGGG
jgi:ribokinase